MMAADRKTLLLILAALVLLALNGVLFVVKETERAIMLQFGRIVAADIPPGLHWKLPVIHQIKKFDARVLTVDGEPQSFFTIERKRLIVDSFAKWRIIDVEGYYKATGGIEELTQSRLADRISDGLRNQFGTRTLYEVVSGERDALMEQMAQTLNSTVQESLGIEILDVRVRRIDLPPEVSEQVFQRMTAEREKEARELRAVGMEAGEKLRAEADREVTIIRANAYRDSELIRGDGDAEATRIYGEAFTQHPDLYEFTRSLNAYRTAFDSSDDLLVLEPNSEFFRFLGNPRGVQN